MRSPVIYKNMPRKIQYRNVVKHIVKPIERKVVIEEKQPPHIFAQQTDSSNDATEFVQTQQHNRRQTNSFVYQQNVRSQLEGSSDSDEREGEVLDDSRPLEFSRIYYKQSFPSNFPN